VYVKCVYALDVCLASAELPANMISGTIRRICETWLVRLLSFPVGCRVALLVLFFISASHVFGKCIVLISIHAYKWSSFLGP
jgi:hypothetical protein